MSTKTRRAGAIEKTTAADVKPARARTMHAALVSNSPKNPKTGLVARLRSALRNRDEPTALFGSLGPLGPLVATRAQQSADAKRIVLALTAAAAAADDDSKHPVPSADDDDEAEPSSAHSSDYESDAPE